MKKIYLITLVLSSLLQLYSCNKSTQDITDRSKVDVLLEQFKSDSTFLAYLKTINANMEIFKVKLSNLPISDSTIIRDKSLSFEEKNKKLGIIIPEEVAINQKKGREYLQLLYSKYPEFKTLSDEESKLLFKKAYAHYFNQKSK